MTAGDDIARALTSVGPAPMSGLDRRMLGDLRARLLGRSSLPHTIGRFTVLSEVGRGGMGTVYAVYDPQLDRKVALKALLEPSREDRESVLSEAQRLAKVRHPNVTAVHEAFVEDGVVYVAMELVEGETLDVWQTTHDPSPREQIDVLIQAGLGLQAVHDAGLVHRDFKPANVLVEPGGRVQLLDFGLAVALDDESRSVAGTTGYIAPECLAGESPSAHSDQYAFCVVATEMFADGAPPRVAEVLRRGMDPDPRARPPDMRHVLAQLSAAVPIPGRRRRTVLLLAGGAAGAAVLAWGTTEGRAAYHTWQDSKREAACAMAAQTAIDGVWSGSRRESVRSGLTRDSAPYAASAAEKTLALVDDYAQRWTRSHVSACMSPGDVNQERRAAWCLEAGRVDLDVMLESFESAEPGVTATATEVIAGLSPPDLCSDPAALARAPAPPSASRQQALAAVLRDLSRVAAANRAGRGDRGLALAEQALEDAQQIAWAPMVATAHLRLAEILANAERHEEARSHAEDAFFEARRAEASTLAIAAALALSEHVGVSMADHEAGLLWLRHAELLIDAEPERLRPRSRAEALSARASIAHAHGDLESAATAHAEAAAALKEVVGETHPAYADALNDLGTAQSDLGRWGDAIVTLEQSVEVAEQSLGEQHPSVGAVLLNLSVALRRSERFDRALEIQQRALDIEESALGPDHPGLVATYSNLAGLRGDMGDLEGELQARRKAVSLAQNVPGPPSTNLVIARSNLAYALKKAGHTEAAEAEYATLIPLVREVLGEDHYLLGRMLNNRATTLSDLGKNQASADAYARALEIYELHQAPPADVAITSGNYAVQLAELGRVDEALARVKQAIATLEEHAGPGHANVAAAKVKLGRILRLAGREGEAGDVYREALRMYEAIPGEQAGEVSTRALVEALE